MRAAIAGARSLYALLHPDALGATLLLCLVLGAALRLARPDLVAFKLDEAKFVGIIDSAAGGAWPASGAMSSWGILQPPLRAYLLAPARWLTSDVTAVSGLLGLVSLLNLAAVGLVAARFSGAAAGAAVALACASPWALHFGRALWDAPVPLFGTLGLYAALRAGGGDSRWGVAVVPLLVLQALTHLTGWSALPLAAYLAIRFREFRDRWFAVGAALGTAIAVPYLGTLLTASAPVGQALGSRLSSPALPEVGVALQFAFWYVSGADLQALLGPTHAPHYPFSLPLAVGPFVAAGLLLAGVWACIGALRSVDQPSPRTRADAASPSPKGSGGPYEGAHHSALSAQRSAGEILLAWVAIPLLATMALPGQLFVHYFQVWGGGAPFGLAGVGFAWLYERLRMPAARALALIVLAAIPLVQSGSWVALLARLERLPDTAVGPTLGAWQDLAWAARDAAGASKHVVAWTVGDQPAYQDQPAVLKLLLGPDIEPVFMRRDSVVLIDSGPNVFITTPPRAEPRWGFTPLPGVQVVRSTPAGSAWTAGEGSAAGATPAPAHVRFADGIQLEGYSWRASTRASQEIEIATFWRIGEPSPRARTADLTLFVHLEDPEQRVVAQDDGLDWPSRRWAPGTRIVQHSILDASRLLGDGWVRLGLYSRQDLQRSPRLDTGGDSVLIGPIQRARGGNVSFESQYSSGLRGP